MIELIVFGKGFGESILLRVGDKWIIIDSFIEPESNLPIAVKYLEDNGFSAEDILGIICSHWDNDHVEGISQIINLCSKRLPVCFPIAFNDIRFTEYLNFNSDPTIDTTSEFLKVLNLSAQKKIESIYALSGRLLFEREINDSSVEVKALSPNDVQFAAFLDGITKPEKGQIKRKTVLDENKISMVTYVRTCLDSILLGGDMENSSLGGWDSICNSFIFDNKCHVFKIPHHGSQTGFNSRVWTSVVERPISIITRFNRSHLPTEEMIGQIMQESEAVYVIGPVPSKDRNTLKRVKRFEDSSPIRSMDMLDYKYGYVRLSKTSQDQDWSISTYGSVKKYPEI